MSEHELLLSAIQELNNNHLKVIERLDKLTSIVVGSSEWISPEVAAKLLNRNIVYLTNNKDKMGLVYSQEKKHGKILFSYASVMEFIQSKSSKNYLKWKSAKR
jgi:hypothetical protein